MSARRRQLRQPYKLTLCITEGCNLDCRHCYSDCAPVPRPEEMDTRELLAVVDELVELETLHLFIEGGEPLLRPDLMTVLEATCPNMLTWVRTNGTLVDEGVARRFREVGVGTVCVDVWAATPSTHDRIAGTPGAFERSVRGVRALRAAGVKVIMLLILNRHNVAELQDYLRLARNLDVDTVGILRLYPLGRARRRWQELALSLGEMYAALARLEAPHGMQVMASWHPNDPNCCWQNAAITATGDSVGCPYLREFVNYGNVRNMSFRDTWHHPLYTMLRSDAVDSGCDDCDRSQHSRGGCRSTAYAFNGSWRAPDPFCLEMNAGVDLRELPKRLL